MARTPTLEELGWSSHFENSFEVPRAKGWTPARIVRTEKDRYTAQDGDGARPATVAGRLRRRVQRSSAMADLPVVGDWVALERPAAGGDSVIRAVLPRRTAFSRQAAGTATREQVLAANIDTALLVTAFGRDLNPRRLERYLTVVAASGAEAVIAVNKADLAADVTVELEALRAVASGVPLHAVSALEEDGLWALDPYLSRGRTLVLLGSSGVGKSTMVNRLLGEMTQRVAAVRAHDGRGRHTTTGAALFTLPSGANLIDTAGLRELQLWADLEAVGETFADIEELARGCKFRDCGHETEPGCAVNEAIERGELDAARFESYRKLEREVRYHERREDDSLRRLEEEKWRAIHRSMRKLRRYDPKR